MNLSRLKPHSFMISLVSVVMIASILPCRGSAAQVFRVVTDLAVALLFFFHGARLSRKTVLAGIAHVKLHAIVLASTFVVFPLLGLLLRPLAEVVISAPLYTGILFLCVVPSTIQSSIALTAIARGNVAAAVCSASLSSLLGIVLTPLLARVLGLTASAGTSDIAGMQSLVVELLAPFVAGQVARRFMLAWVERNRSKLRWLDEGAVLLTVYTAFSAAVVQGLWREIPLAALLGVAVIASVLLALALLLTWRGSKLLGFSREDEIVIVFCGSKKSLASGVPLANVLFPAHAVGAMVLPLMLFHQLQLFVCGMLAQRYAANTARADT